MVDKANQGDRCNRVSEMRKGGKEAKIGMSMMSHRSLREGCAKRAWNSYYRRCFEWEVFGQIEVEMKYSAFVWAFGLVIVSTSANVRFFWGAGGGIGLTAALIVHFQWKRLASSYVTERP